MILENKQESSRYVKNSFKASLFLFFIACATSLIYRTDKESVDIVIHIFLLFSYTLYIFLTLFLTLFLFYFAFKKIFKDGILAGYFARYSFYLVPTITYLYFLYIISEFNFKETTIAYNLYLLLTLTGIIFGAYLLGFGLLILTLDKLISFGQKSAQ